VLIDSNVAIALDLLKYRQTFLLHSHAADLLSSRT